MSNEKTPNYYDRNNSNETVTIELSRYEGLMSKISKLEELFTKVSKDNYIIEHNYNGGCSFYHNRKDFDSKLIELHKKQQREIRTLKEQLSRLDGKSFWQRLFN